MAKKIHVIKVRPVHVKTRRKTGPTIIMFRGVEPAKPDTAEATPARTKKR
jgi:hypothetical protein